MSEATVVEETVSAAEDASPTEDSRSGNEAAKYRRQLRDTEAERDALQEQVGALRKTIADTALGELLERPEGFWATGATPESFFTEEGTLDLDALKNAVSEASTTFGLAQPGLSFEREGGLGVKGTNPTPTASWQQVISPE